MTHQVGDTQKSTTRLAEGAKGYSYSRTPEGNTVEKAVELLGKYTIPVTLTSATYYAYQYLDNDLTTSLTIDADVAGVLDLSPYFSTLKDSTISFISDFADGTPTKIDNINISPTAATGSKSATIELSNKTRISFTVNISRSDPKLELDGWQFECRIEPGTPEVILTSVRQSGDPDLVIPETIEIFGEQCKIVGFNNNLFNNNKDLQTISLPSTFEFLGENSLFAQSFTGGEQIFDVDIKNDEVWTITMDVVRTGELTGWGVCLLASGNTPAKPDGSNYAEGFQLYLQCTEKGAARDKLIIKTKEEVNDVYYFDDVYQEKKFTVVVEYNGAQQLSVNVLKADGTNATNHDGKQEPIVFTGCTIQDITQLCTNIQAAITSHFVID